MVPNLKQNQGRYNPICFKVPNPKKYQVGQINQITGQLLGIGIPRFKMDPQVPVCGWRLGIKLFYTEFLWLILKRRKDL